MAASFDTSDSLHHLTQNPMKILIFLGGVWTGGDWCSKKGSFWLCSSSAFDFAGEMENSFDHDVDSDDMSDRDANIGTVNGDD